MVKNNKYAYIKEKYTNLTWQNMLRICIIKCNEVTVGSCCLKENVFFKEWLLSKGQSPNQLLTLVIVSNAHQHTLFWDWNLLVPMMVF